MHPAFNTQLVQSHIADLRRAGAAEAIRAEARRANLERRAVSPQVITLPAPSFMRRLVGRVAH